MVSGGTGGGSTEYAPSNTAITAASANIYMHMKYEELGEDVSYDVNNS